MHDFYASTVISDKFKPVTNRLAFLEQGRKQLYQMISYKK